jgi:superfamily I DNA and/or RNA helicase
LAETTFDLVVVDEAARCAPGELAVPIQSAKRVLLVGDHLQLEPFHDRAVVERAAKALAVPENAVRTSDFQRAFNSLHGKAHGQALTVQHRMIEPIGRLVSTSFYEPAIILQHGERKGPALPVGMGPGTLDKPVVWLDISGYGPKAYQSQAGARRKSLINAVEADVIVEVLVGIDEDQDFKQWMSDNLDETAKSIGVICGYSEQKKLLLQKIAGAGLSPGFRDRVKVDTIDSYQGKQNLIVLLSLVRNNADRPDGTIAQGFMSRLNRINVAMSRARDRLVIVGSAERWPTDGPMARVSATAKILQSEGHARIVNLASGPGNGKAKKHAATQK